MGAKIEENEIKGLLPPEQKKGIDRVLFVKFMWT